MKEIKRIMACVDLSDYTVMTVDYALALVKGTGAEILLFNVINNRDMEAVRMVSPYFPGDFNMEDFLERKRSERRRLIQEMFDKHFPANLLPTSILIETGVPYEAILKAINREKVDLVVLGNKGKSNLVGTLHGSNGEKVFRHSPVPVLSVRSRERFRRNR